MKDGINVVEESKSLYTVYYAANGYVKITSVVSKQSTGKWRVTDSRLETGYVEYASKQRALASAKRNSANIHHYLTRYPASK